MSDSGILRFDAERARAVEAIYLTPDVVAQREEVLRALDPRTGERVLDLGVGPGLLASAIAERVGAGGAVHGIDVSPDMLAIAAASRPGPTPRSRIRSPDRGSSAPNTSSRCATTSGVR